MIMENPRHCVDLGLDVPLLQPEVDHSRVGEPESYDQLTEVAVGRDENTIVAESELEDIPIRRRLGVVLGHRRDVMAKVNEVATEAEVGTCVE